MPNTQNIQKVSVLVQKVEKSSSIIFFDYKNLSSNAVNDLRRVVGQVSAEMVVAKNTLVKIALGSMKALDSDLQGQTGVVFAFGDSIAPLKALAAFAKKFEALKIKGAFIDGIYYVDQKVAQLSQLPSKLDLMAKVLAGFKNPLYGLVNVVGGVRTKFVYALVAVAKAKEVGK